MASFGVRRTALWFAALMCTACLGEMVGAERRVAGDLTLTILEGAYYLRHPGLADSDLGLGPLSQLGCTPELVAVQLRDGNWRVVRVVTHAGWDTPVSDGAAHEAVRGTVSVRAVENAWGNLRACR